MNKNKQIYVKYTFLSFGISLLCLSPLVYLDFYGQYYTNIKEYNKALKYYKHIELFSNKYKSRVVECHYLNFIKEYLGTHTYSKLFYLLNSENSSLGNMIDTNKKEYSQILLYNILSKVKNFEELYSKKEVSLDTINTFQKKINNENIKNKDVLYDILNLTKINCYGLQAVECFYEKKYEKSFKTIQKALNIYQDLKKRKANPNILVDAQDIIISTYNDSFDDNESEEKTLYEKKMYSVLQGILTDNEKIVLGTNEMFDVKCLLPFKTKEEVDQLFLDFLKFYYDPINNKPIFQICIEEFCEIDMMPEKFQRMYSKKYPGFNLIHSIVYMEDFYYNEGKEDIFLNRVHNLEKKNNMLLQDYQLYTQEIITLLKVHHYYMISIWNYLDEKEYKKAVDAFDKGKKIYESQMENQVSTTSFQFNYNYLVLSIIKDALEEKSITEQYSEKELFPFKNEVEKTEKLNKKMLKTYGELYYVSNYW